MPADGTRHRSARRGADRADGALPTRDIPSPNHGPRRNGARPDIVVLHFTGMAPDAAAIARLSAPESGVSCHWLIEPGGALVRMVDEDRRAWHAGAGAWGPVGDVNSRSIGIEICNTGTRPFAAPQMDALESLLAAILSRHAISPARVIGHSDCAPGRKADPGPRFDWMRLARRGLAAPTPPGCAGGEIAPLLRAAGYTGSDDADACLAALRLRHRPRARGPADARDRGIAAGLAGQAD